MKFIIKKGTTSRILHIFIQDSSSTTGAGLTGLLFNSSGLAAYYIRPGQASPTAITLVTAIVGTYASSGFIEIDAVNMPGWYELHVPGACLTTGAVSCGVHLKGAANMAPLPLEIQLDDNTVKDAYDIANHASYGNAQLVRSTTPANTLDVAATGEAGIDFDNVKGTHPTVPTVTNVTNDVGITQAGADLVWGSAARTLTSFGTLIADIWSNTVRAVTGGTIDTNTDMRGTDGASTHGDPDPNGYIDIAISSRSSHDAASIWAVGARALTDKANFSLSTAGIKAIWDQLTSALTTVGSIGKLLVDNVNATISSRSSHAATDIWSVGTRTLTSFGTLIADIWAYTTRTLTAGTKDAEIDAIKAKTDVLNFTANNVHAHVKTEDDIDFGATKKASINTEMDNALNTAIPGSPTADSVNEVLKNQAKAASTFVTGKAVAGTLSTTEMTTDLTEITDDHYNGQTIKWTTGVLKNQATSITDYNGTTKKLTFIAVTESPAVDDEWVFT